MLSLAGKVVLVADDDLLLAIDLEQRLTDAGALVVGVRTVADAMRFAEEPRVSVAVIDGKLVGGDCTPICERLKAHGIPIVFFSEDADVQPNCSPSAVIPKSADPGTVIDAVARLLRSPKLPACSRGAGGSDLGQVMSRLEPEG
jgi:DNA-binding NtrC family response regulator